MADILRYGKVFRAYKAYGDLEFDTKDSFHCSFDAVQFVDGALRVQCYFPGEKNYEQDALMSNLTAGITIRRISGITEDNEEIVLEGQILWTNVDHRRTADSEAIAIALVATEMLIVPKEISLPIQTLRFGITNFEFEGNIVREQNTETSHLIDRGILAVNLPFAEIRVERLPSYDEAVANIRATQSIEPTSEISLELSEHDIEWAKDVADDLCTILSLAKGTKIVWFYLDGYDAKGIKRLTLQKYAITRPYSGGSASVIALIYPNDIKELVENGYERLVQLKFEYRFSHVIDSYLEAKRPHSYLESRGLAAIQAMELLAGQYADKHNLVYIMDENEFSERLSKAGATIREVLQVTLGENSVIGLCGENNEKLKSLNRRTLRQVLKQLFQDFGMQVSGRKLNALIETRNALVHRGSFNTNDRVKEFYRIISIMDTLLLKMLGYDGYILDCEQKWARIKLQAKANPSR